VSTVNGKMVGRDVVDYHKNTARSKHVNDRLRRRQKRIERSRIEFFSVLLGR
jgi:hypothetical protein